MEEEEDADGNKGEEEQSKNSVGREERQAGWSEHNQKMGARSALGHGEEGRWGVNTWGTYKKEKPKIKGEDPSTSSFLLDGGQWR